VVKEPETRFVGNAGTQLTQFTVCHTRNYQKDGAWQKDSTFIDVKCWSTTAERAASLNKGDEVICSGRLVQESWQSKDGSQRSKLVLIADKLDVVGQSRPKPAPAQSAHADNDLPF